MWESSEPSDTAAAARSSLDILRIMVSMQARTTAGERQGFGGGGEAMATLNCYHLRLQRDRRYDRLDAKLAFILFARGCTLAQYRRLQEGSDIQFLN